MLVVIDADLFFLRVEIMCEIISTLRTSKYELMTLILGRWYGNVHEIFTRRRIVVFFPTGG